LMAETAVSCCVARILPNAIESDVLLDAVRDFAAEVDAQMLTRFRGRKFRSDRSRKMALPFLDYKFYRMRRRYST
jgi:hypothetical protein